MIQNKFERNDVPIQAGQRWTNRADGNENGKDHFTSKI